MGMQIRLIVSVLNRGQYMCTKIAAIHIYVRAMKSKKQYSWWGYHKLSCVLSYIWLHYNDTLPSNLVFCLHRLLTNLAFYFLIVPHLYTYMSWRDCVASLVWFFSCRLYNIICFLSSPDTCKGITYVYTYSSGESNLWVKMLITEHRAQKCTIMEMAQAMPSIAVLDVPAWGFLQNRQHPELMVCLCRKKYSFGCQSTYPRSNNKG